MNSIAQNITELKNHIPQRVKIVAVSKTKTIAQIREAVEAGQYLFGENKVQELVAKHDQLPDAQWHFIGHLQTNKVKHIAPFIKMIHSVDSFRLLDEINKQAAKHDRVIDCLLQIHIAQEKTKFGLEANEATDLLDMPAIKTLESVRICGLMGVATFTDDADAIQKEFRRLADLHKLVAEKYFADNGSFNELSMGMSDDYPIAINEGSTMVRVGSLIFGEREYNKA